MTVHVADHPLISHKLGMLRKKDIHTKDFRDLASEVARLLTYEATKDLETQTKVIEGWAGEVYMTPSPRGGLGCAFNVGVEEHPRARGLRVHAVADRVGHIGDLALELAHQQLRCEEQGVHQVADRSPCLDVAVHVADQE